MKGVILLVKSRNVTSSVRRNFGGTSADKGANSILMYVTFIIIIVFSSVSFFPGLNQLQAARGGKRGVNMNPIVLLMCAGSPGASVFR